MSTSQNSLVIDAADPNSLAMILPPPLDERVRTIPTQLLIQDEETLTTLVNPSQQQRRIKIQFWDEYELAIKQERTMILNNITFGVCTREYFSEFSTSVRNMAWLISPRPSYRVRVAELIDKGLDNIEKIFSMEITEKNATAVRGLQLRALHMIDMRKHGGYTQRQEIRALTKNINTNENRPQDIHILGEGTIEQLEQQVRDMENKILTGKNQNGSLLNGSIVDLMDGEGHPRDVGPGDV